MDLCQLFPVQKETMNAFIHASFSLHGKLFALDISVVNSADTKPNKY